MTDAEWVGRAAGLGGKDKVTKWDSGGSGVDVGRGPPSYWVSGVWARDWGSQDGTQGGAERGRRGEVGSQDGRFVPVIVVDPLNHVKVTVLARRSHALTRFTLCWYFRPQNTYYVDEDGFPVQNAADKSPNRRAQSAHASRRAASARHPGDGDAGTRYPRGVSGAPLDSRLAESTLCVLATQQQHSDRQIDRQTHTHTHTRTPSPIPTYPHTHPSHPPTHTPTHTYTPTQTHTPFLCLVSISSVDFIQRLITRSRGCLCHVLQLSERTLEEHTRRMDAAERGGASRGVPHLPMMEPGVPPPHPPGPPRSNCKKGSLRRVHHTDALGRPIRFKDQSKVRPRCSLVDSHNFASLMVICHQSNCFESALNQRLVTRQRCFSVARVTCSWAALSPHSSTRSACRRCVTSRCTTLGRRCVCRRTGLWTRVTR